MDNLRLLFNLVGTLAIIVYGIASFLRPRWIAQLLAFTLHAGRGDTEFRVGMGGYFIGIGMFALVTHDPIAFKTLGVGWLCAAFARTISTFWDKPKIDLTYGVFFLCEVLFGFLLIL